MRRKIRYLLWLWFGYLQTNERPIFEHYRDAGAWPWDKGGGDRAE